MSVPSPPRRIVVSGVATAAIIYTTTLMFTFSGVSIVLAMLIMRGGVLVLAPLMDFAFRAARAMVCVDRLRAGDGSPWRRSRPVAGRCSSAGRPRHGEPLRRRLCRPPAGVNSGAKSRDVACTRRYFVDEQLVAMATLVVVPCSLASAGSTGIAVTMRVGLARLFLTTRTSGWRIAIGVLYACLYVLRHVDLPGSAREHLLHRAQSVSSVLAGVAGSAGIA